MSKAAATATSAAAAPKTITSASGATFKRPESENAGEITYVRLGKLSAGDTVVEGVFTGTSQNKMYPEKLDFMFQDANGNKVVVNEGGNLKYRMKDITPGTLVMIIYQGKSKITKGQRAGKESHNVEVLIAD